MERNVNILDWQNSIEYQMYNDVEYQDLDDVTKIVCIVYDFFDLTKGKWSTSDLLLLKKAMALIGINPKNKISYENFIQKLSANSELCRHLLGEDFSFATEYEAIAFSLNKMNRLATEEKYLVQATKKSLAKNGINISDEEIIYQITEDFVAQEADFHLSTEVSNYELILELLYNLAQVQYAKEQIRLQKKLQEKLALAKKLFMNYKIIEALPSIVEMAEVGNIQARYMLAVMQREIFTWKDHIVKEMLTPNNVPISDDYFNFLDEFLSCYGRAQIKEWLAQNISAGDICSIFRGWLFDLVDRNELKNYLEELTALADSGDVFAQYERAYYEKDDSPLREKYYKMAAEQDYVFAQKELAFIYHFAHGVEKNNKKAIELLKKVHDKGNYQEYWIEDFYGELGEHEEQLKWLQSGEKRCERDFVWRLGCFYYFSGGEKYKNYLTAMRYFKRSIELGKSSGYEEYFIGKMYLDGGYGITASRSTAREWLKKAADKGNSDAQKWLREN